MLHLGYELGGSFSDWLLVQGIFVELLNCAKLSTTILSVYPVAILLFRKGLQ